MPATIVGSAKGRSMIEFTQRLPGKSSRTSTQAMIVPATALIATTITEAIRVSLSAATACGELTASQNSPSPPSNDFATTAASGMRTIRLRYPTTRPRVRPGPPRPSLKPGLGGASAVATAP
jgi:hypothetical protein